MLIAWVAGLFCLGLIALGVCLGVGMEKGEYVLLIIPGIIGGLFALIGGQAAVAMVSPKRMTDDYIWLKGVHSGFLDRLEVWPYTNI